MFLIDLKYSIDFETKRLTAIVTKMNPTLHYNLFGNHHTEITADVNGVGLDIGMVYYMDQEDLIIELTDESDVVLSEEEDVTLRIQTTSTRRSSYRPNPAILIGMEYWVRPKGERDFKRLPEYDDNRAFLNALGPAY